MNLKRGTCRPAAFLIAALLISTLAAVGVRAASLNEVKSVYLFPMANGLDQYLADRLTRDHILLVVTDPKAADAVFTDQLGAGFEAQLLKVRPDLKPVPPKKETADKDKDKDAKDDAKKDEKADRTVPMSSFHSTQGTIFIVHARTQTVVWSTYLHSNNHSPKDMERAAAKIAGLLEKDLAPPVALAPAKK